MSAEEEEASSMAVINEQHYDLHNVPGHIKKALIESGTVSIDKFFIAPGGIDRNNAPGSVLAPLKAEHRKRMSSLVGKDKVKGNPYSIGDMVEYRKEVREIIAISSKNKDLVKLTQKSGEESKWISYEKLKPVKINEEE